jgi:hypothetical protein
MTCKKNKVDNLCMDENNDIYPCFYYKCNNYHFYEDYIDKIKCAIRFLQINRLKDLFCEKDILKINMDMNENILDYLLNHLISISGNNFNIPTIDIIDYSKFNNNRTIFEYEKKNINKLNLINQSKDLYLQILDYICKNYSELITQKQIEKTVHYNAKPITDILMKYFIETNIDDNNKCCICFSNIRVQLIDNICLCKNKIHYNCLIDCIQKNNKNNCSVCKTKYEYFLDSRKRFIFPYANIYPAPLISSKIHFIDKNDKSSQLHFALVYLIIPRIKQILDDMTYEEFINYKKHADYYGLHKSHFYELLDMPYSNLSKEKHLYEFNEISNLLQNKLDKK